MIEKQHLPSFANLEGVVVDVNAQIANLLGLKLDSVLFF